MAVGLKFYQSFYWPTVQVKIHEKFFTVQVADNLKHWEKGLGGREDLGKYDGMLFVFPEIKQHVFVMRDMKFPLDIIWLKNGVVVDIAANLPIEPTSSESDLIPYFSRDSSDKVLELGAGKAASLGLKIGDRVEVVR